MALSEQLHVCIADLESATSQLQGMEQRLKLEDWQRRPGEGRWSALECIDHLSITSRAFLPLLDDALRTANEQSLKGDGPFHMDPFGWLLVRALSSRSRFSRSKTAEAFVPRDARRPEEVLPEFYRLQYELSERIRQSEGMRIDKVKVQSPFDARVKYNVFSAYRIIPVHEHRHLAQAERAAMGL